MAMAMMPHMKRWLDLRMSCLIMAYYYIMYVMEKL